MDNSPSKLVMELDALVDSVKPITAYYLTKKIVVGAEEYKTLMKELEFSPFSDTLFYRNIQIRRSSLISHLAIEIARTSR